jgi:hypothetical protein
MAIIRQNFLLIQGDSKTYNLYFQDTSGTRLDITGWTVYFVVKRQFSDPDADAVISKTVTVHTDPTQGETTIVLETTDTENIPEGVYRYSIRILTPAGKLYTLMRGDYKIEEVADMGF